MVAGRMVVTTTAEFAEIKYRSGTVGGTRLRARDVINHNRPRVAAAASLPALPAVNTA